MAIKCVSDHGQSYRDSDQMESLDMVFALTYDPANKKDGKKECSNEKGQDSGQLVCEEPIGSLICGIIFDESFIEGDPVYASTYASISR